MEGLKTARREAFDAETQHLASIFLDLSVTNHKGKPITDMDRVSALSRLVKTGKLPTFAPLLPAALNLKGDPYTLRDYAPFESLFRIRLPKQLLLMAARQTSKSTSIAARNLMLCVAVKNFHILFITPLYEQIRRFSTNYMRPFIEQSPLKELWIGTGTENSVLQRSFKNFNKMYFSFALTDADRVRGISCDSCNYDEIQDMDQNLIPIIAETMAASPWRLSMYAGTPKTLDNTIEGKWCSSSQAEWVVPCFNCKKLNVPRIGLDLEKMIGKWHDGIGPLNPTTKQLEKGIEPGIPATICAKCGKWIDPRKGHWEHDRPELIHKFPGYHIPQIIMPLHYEDKDRWSELRAKREGYGNCTMSQFYNEVLATSYDIGAKLVTKTDLQNASILPWENNPEKPSKELAQRSKDYVTRVLGVDWGGGGEDEVSFTVMAVVGMRPDGKLDVIWGRKLFTPHDHMVEAIEVMKAFNFFRCNHVAHDYNGAGSLRETIMVQAGMPQGAIVPFVYMRSAAKNIVTYHKSEQEHSRNYWMLDKTRSLQLTCQSIKQKWIRLFKHDYVSEENRGLQHDFLALMENKVEMPRGPDVYMIQRNPHFSDDFAHAVNYAAGAIWHYTKSWPNLAKIAGLTLNAEQMRHINPINPWKERGGFQAMP